MAPKKIIIAGFFSNPQQIADACGVDTNTARKWITLPDFPAKAKDGWPEKEVLQYTISKKSAEATQMRGKDSDIKRVKLMQQVKKLIQDERRAKAEADKAERDAEMHKIEYESKRKQWFSLEQVRRFAFLVVQAFDDAQQSVAMVTRDEKAVKAVQTEFDRVRKKLAREVGEIK